MELVMCFVFALVFFRTDGFVACKSAHSCLAACQPSDIISILDEPLKCSLAGLLCIGFTQPVVQPAVYNHICTTGCKVQTPCETHIP